MCIQLFKNSMFLKWICSNEHRGRVSTIYLFVTIMISDFSGLNEVIRISTENFKASKIKKKRKTVFRETSIILRKHLSYTLSLASPAAQATGMPKRINKWTAGWDDPQNSFTKRVFAYAHSYHILSVFVVISVKTFYQKNTSRGNKASA